MKQGKPKKPNEPELTQEEKNIILDSVIAASKKKGSRPRNERNPILLDYLSKHKVLIEYVKDIYGFKKGVVVATAQDRVGWSLIDAWDVRIEQHDPIKLPAVQKLIKGKVTLEQITSSKSYKRAIKEHCAIPVPIFDPNIGIFIAIGRSLSSNISESASEQGETRIKPPPPNDVELLTAIQKMLDRSKRYFK